MKKLIYICLVVAIIFSVCACSSQNNEPVVDNEEKVEEELFPKEVKEIQNLYLTAITSKNLPFRVGKIEEDKSGDSVFYEFYLLHNDADPNQLVSSLPSVKVQEYRGKIDGNFSITFHTDHNSNAIIKDNILLTLLALEPSLSLEEGEALTKQLANTYDDITDSDIVSLSKYKVYLHPFAIPNALTIDSIYLEAVNIKNINIPIDTSEYKNYTSEEMLAPLNQGLKAHIKGTVSDILKEAINVKCGNEIYYVKYDKKDFLGIINDNQQYDFYGTISERPVLLDGYDGCIWLEYVGEKNLSQSSPNTPISKSQSTASQTSVPTFTGGTCLSVNSTTGMPADNTTNFSLTDTVWLAGKITGVSGEPSLTIRWTCPDGHVIDDKFYYAKSGETTNGGYKADYIGVGTGKISVILDTTGEILANYSFNVSE